MLIRRLRHLVVLTALGLCVASLSAIAEDYPNRPIRMVVVAPAGGTADTVARNLSSKLSDRLGQQVIVDNRPSNAGIVGYDLVAHSPPDGYTLVMATGTLATVGILYPSVRFDAVKDFEPVAWVLTTPYVLVVSPTLPVNSLGTLIEYAKANPGKLSYAGGTTGAQQHLAGEMLKRRNSFDMLYVPYKGTGAMMPDLLGGRLDVAIDNVLVMAPYVKNGTLRGLAVTSATRSPVLPELPTIAEAGAPGFRVIGWFGVFAPAKTPTAIINKLNAEMAAIMRRPDVTEPLLAQGAEPQSGPPEALQKLLAEEIAQWSKVIREAGIRAE
jgi:tripartite-type tricarboxylate transporter receptor subunit TctC